MSTDEKKKRRFVAITRQLKEQKGLTIKQSELQQGIKTLKEAQKKIDDLQATQPDSEFVKQEAVLQKKKLQSVIDELNEYMRILHPEGLLDMGTGSSGKAIVGHG